MQETWELDTSVSQRVASNGLPLIACYLGMHILGPLPMAQGQRKILLVAVDYFTKWIEAEPLANISTQPIQKFLWRNIITRFGILNTLVHPLVYNSGNPFFPYIQDGHNATS